MKRFYKEVSVGPVAGDSDDAGWRVLLDGRPIKTAGGRAQAVPSRALAEALAAEWDAQGEKIELASFRYRDLTDFAIDAVASDRVGAIASILPYAETDTLCYRADPDEALYKRQQEVWEPLLAAAEAELGVPFTRVSGIIHRPQGEATLAAIAARMEALDDFTLAALKMLSSLAASLVIALAAIKPDADADGLWKAANLEEDWQVELWGEDWEAAERRAARLEAFKLAIAMAALVRES